MRTVSSGCHKQDSRRTNQHCTTHNITSLYGSSCANNGKGAPNTPDIVHYTYPIKYTPYMYLGCWVRPYWQRTYWHGRTRTTKSYYIHCTCMLWGVECALIGTVRIGTGGPVKPSRVTHIVRYVVGRRIHSTALAAASSYREYITTETDKGLWGVECTLASVGTRGPVKRSSRIHTLPQR
eukprot:1917679-Pyramimonas_sp.AAC.1